MCVLLFFDEYIIFCFYYFLCVLLDSGTNSGGEVAELTDQFFGRIYEEGQFYSRSILERIFKCPECAFMRMGTYFEMPHHTF